MTRTMLATSSITGDRVRNEQNEDLGKIEDLMVDLSSGRIGYAVLSFGGFLGLGDKLFAVPWEALTPDLNNQEFILNVDRELLENAPGFDKSNWPDFADPEFGTGIYSHYGYAPYWESATPKTRRTGGL